MKRKLTGVLKKVMSEKTTQTLDCFYGCGEDGGVMKGGVMEGGCDGEGCDGGGVMEGV